MPSKREARNNAFSDPQYAFLGLHQAAHSGNIGLVEYALSEGQPVDAVWDGISPLHAAAAGGSEHVTRLLIEKGADVNIGRQHTKEREMKLRAVSSSSSLIPSPDNSIPPDRSEALLNPGSTPLHYACAHNNVAVARLLLAAGAAPHIPDKRGITPLDLLPPSTIVPGSGSSPPTDTLRAVIREYYENEKAKEKEFNKSQSSQTLRSQSKAGTLLGVQRSDDDTNFTSPFASNSSNGRSIPIPSTPNRIGAKRSLENLLSMSSSVSPRHIPPPLSPNGGTSLTSHKSPPPSPAKFTFGNPTPNAVPTHPSPGPISSSPPQYVYTERRPSLPHVFSSSSGSNVSRPPMPTQQSSSTASTSEPFRPRSADGEQGGHSTTLPLPPNSAHAHSGSIQGYTPPNQQLFDVSRHPHGHHAHTHSATLPTAIANAASSSAASRPPRTKRSLLSLFGKNRDEKEDRDKDRGRPKEKDKEKERERSFSRPSFSTLSRPSFSAFSSGGGGNGGPSPTPIPMPSKLSPIPIPIPKSRGSPANHSPSPIVISPPSETTANEVHTAPPERTTFDVPRSSRLKNADEDDEEEEYGVELRRRGGVYDYIENDDEAGSDDDSEWDGEEDEEDDSTSENDSEGGGEDEDEDTNNTDPHDEAIEASQRAADNAVSGSRVAPTKSSRPEVTGSSSQQGPPTASTTSAAPSQSTNAPTFSPSRPPILRNPSNGSRHKNHRNNSNDTSGSLRRSGSLRFELEGQNSSNQEVATNAMRDHKLNGGLIGVGMPDRERKTSMEGVVGRRSGEGTRSPLVRKKSSLVLKERGSLGVVREGTVEDGASPVKKTPKSGMVPLPPTTSPSRYRTSPSDSKITASPRERSRKSSSLSRHSPRTAVPPLPMPPMKIAGSANPVTGSSDSEDDIPPRLRTHSLRSRTPISAGINLRSVSSHAEAEALVKLAAKEIIEMGSTNKDSKGDMPQMSLAEQLARYGETLHLERRFARGEAQRWKSVNDDEGGGDDVPMNPDEESKREAQKAAEEEEERRRKAKERMVWTQRNLDKYAKTEGKDKDKNKENKEKEKDKQDVDLGYMLQRTASLEKENGRSHLLPFAKGSGSNGVRRPHTSDSVQSNASGSTVTPPRFGHNSTLSSSNIRFTPTNQPLKVFHRETPRSGSFDYDRPKFSGTIPMIGRRSEDLYRKRYEESDKGVEEERQQNEHLSPSFGFTVPTSQSPSSGNVTSMADSSPTALPDTPATTTGNMSVADEFGYSTGQSATTSGTGRPLRQRFGLKSLFGKNK